MLFIVSVIVRFVYTYPPDFDSYWIHAMSESVNISGYAKWVFHPASLFGYYPLSYPSALMFFLAFFSGITGLTMHNTIFFTGIFTGIFATFLIYLIGRRLGGFLLGFFSALVFSLSPTVIYYSTNIASGRMFLVMLYPIFILLLMHIFDNFSYLTTHTDATQRKKHNLLIIKYIVLLFISLLFMFMIHRTSQLLFIFIIAAICAVILEFRHKLLGYFKENKVIIFFINRYKNSKVKLFIEFFLVIFILALLKIIDLLNRKRLLINLERKLLPMYNALLSFYSSKPTLSIVIFAVICVIAIFAIILLFVKRKKISSVLNNTSNLIFDFITKDLDKSINIVLFIFMILFFVQQLFGSSFYTPELERFSNVEPLQGSNPFMLFVNFCINLITSVSILSPFLILGLFCLFFKRERNMITWFFILIFIGFSIILIDKNYVKLFFTPIYSIIITVGLLFLLQLITKFNFKFIKFTVFFIILLIIVFTFTSQFRDIFFSTNTVIPIYKEYISTGEYIKYLNCNCSTITTEENIAGVVIFSISGVPGGSHNIYYYVNKSYLKPTSLTFSELIDRIKRGDKLSTLWTLPDWIFGGSYYDGRHTLNIFGMNIYDEIASRIIRDYNEKYYIHDKTKTEPNIYLSLVNTKNKIYDNPITNIYSFSDGVIET
ncbi:MAG: hypothetical protein V1859_10105 [archaeon]